MYYCPDATLYESPSSRTLPHQHRGPLVIVPPPHYYNPHSLPQFTEDQGTLSPPFTQPGGMSPGIWPAPRGPPPPPQMQGPLSQTPLPNNIIQIKQDTSHITSDNRVMN